MNEDIVAIGGFFITTIVLGLGIPLVRAWTRRKELEASGRLVSAGMDDRLLRIEQAIETMAVEIERVAEGQRFVVKLMNDRPAERAALGQGESARRAN